MPHARECPYLDCAFLAGHAGPHSYEMLPDHDSGGRMPRKQFDPDAKTKEALKATIVSGARTLATILGSSYSLDSVEKEAAVFADKFIVFLEED